VGVDCCGNWSWGDRQWQKITLRAGQIADGLGVLDASIGASLATGFAQYAAAVAELA